MLYDNIAPIKEIRVKGNSKPWFDGSISEAINVRVKLKKKFKKKTLPSDELNYFLAAQNKVKKINQVQKV